MSAGKPSPAALADVNRRLAVARSVVSVAAHALNNGETDLELHAADALRSAADSLDDVISELLDWQPDVPPRRLSKRARFVLSVPQEGQQ